jgi:hypothetical protein
MKDKIFWWCVRFGRKLKPGEDAKAVGCVLVVFYAGLRKATQLGDSPPESLARIILGELAAEHDAASKLK